PCAAPLPDLPPFPTRRSSDLAAAYPESVTQWLAQSALDPPPWLVANATAALDRLLVPPSGLLRLWQERGQVALWEAALADLRTRDRKSTRLNSSHVSISYAVF